MTLKFFGGKLSGGLTRQGMTERKTLLMLGQERRSQHVKVGLYCEKHRALKMGWVKLGKVRPGWVRLGWTRLG